MKQILSILSFLIITSCVDSNFKKELATDSNTEITNNSSETLQNLEKNEDVAQDFQIQPLKEFQKATLYKLSDTITSDFNGDGFPDKAFFIKENNTSGIIIKHGKTNQEIRIGFGKEFSTWTDFNCNWVDYWGLVEDIETSEVTFTDDGDILSTKKVILQNPSIAIGEYEVGGGLITFIDGKYKWIHQTC